VFSSVLQIELLQCFIVNAYGMHNAATIELTAAAGVVISAIDAAAAAAEHAAKYYC
jgi:hypothetical protein